MRRSLNARKNISGNLLPTILIIFSKYLGAHPPDQFGYIKKEIGEIVPYQKQHSGKIFRRGSYNGIL